MTTDFRAARCQCGKAILDVAGPPIMTVACYCRSCQDAAKRLGSLPGAPPVADADGGTHFVMERKDRVTCSHGSELLREHRLTPKSSTRRVIAVCCNSAMFLEFKGGHWLSIYKDRFQENDQPSLEMRTMTGERRPGVVFADDIPSPKKHSLRFMWKLMRAWMAMGFKTPKISFVKGAIDA